MEHDRSSLTTPEESPSINDYFKYVGHINFVSEWICADSSSSRHVYDNA
jgi:hypothetical protein